MLNDYIVNNISPQVKELNIFSDACPGQNRNRTLIRFIMSLSISGRFKNVNVYFPVRGHSFLPCDRVFGTIKRVIRNHDRIYSPGQYCDLILSAKKKHPLFQVKQVKNEEITDYKNWWPTCFKKTTKSLGATKVPFKISTYEHFNFKEGEKGYVYARDFIDGMSCNVFKLFKAGRLELPSQRAYTGQVPIKVKKLQDISKITHYITDQFKEFYTNI